MLRRMKHRPRTGVWAGLAVQCAAFAAIARWEERRLLNRFGDDYRAYLDQVPRWVPRCPNRFPEFQPGALVAGGEAPSGGQYSIT
jgi:glutathione S-transferase